MPHSLLSNPFLSPRCAAAACRQGDGRDDDDDDDDDGRDPVAMALAVASPGKPSSFSMPPPPLALARELTAALDTRLAEPPTTSAAGSLEAGVMKLTLKFGSSSMSRTFNMAKVCRASVSRRRPVLGIP